MAKYSRKSQNKVERSMHEMKEGKLKSGRSGKKVTNPKQAIAIGLSEARSEGAKVPKKKGAKKRPAKKKAARKSAGRPAKKSAGARKRAGRPAKKSSAKKSAPKKRGRKRRS
jgi:hypothetical protein